MYGLFTVNIAIMLQDCLNLKSIWFVSAPLVILQTAEV